MALVCGWQIKMEQVVALRAVLDAAGCSVNDTGCPDELRLFNESYDCTSSQRMSCFQTGDLWSLAVNDLGLAGTISSLIGQLTALNRLFLGPNALTSTVPPQIGNLTDLKLLSLNINNLNGTLAPEIGKLTNLNTLSLAYNLFTGKCVLFLINNLLIS